MEQKKTETDKTYWHPAFFADIQIELAEDVTGKYPKTLIRHLREERHYSLKKTEPGIYLVQGDFLPIQIIVTRKLSKQKNLWLKSLTNKLDTASASPKQAVPVRDYYDYAGKPKNISGGKQYG